MGLRNYFVSLVVVLFAQTLLIPLTSTNLSPVPEKIGTDGWDGILEIQLFFDLLLSVLLLANAKIMYLTDKQVLLCIKSQPPPGSNGSNFCLSSGEHTENNSRSLNASSPMIDGNEMN